MEERATVECSNGNYGNYVAFVFACPGQKELNEEHVLAGQTGTNLNKLLKILNGKCSKLFPFTDKVHYLLTNASNKVHYNGYCGSNRTLPLKKDVFAETNLTRL